MIGSYGWHHIVVEYIIQLIEEGERLVSQDISLVWESPQQLLICNLLYSQTLQILFTELGS